MGYTVRVPFRDERDSLYAKIEKLEADNARLRGEVAERRGETAGAAGAVSPEAPTKTSGFVLVSAILAAAQVLALTSRPSPKQAPVTTTPVAATWNARVLEAEGVALAPGAACQISSAGTVSSDGGTFVKVSVRCGEHTLYSTDEAREQSQGGGVTTAEMPRLRGPGESGFRLLYDEASFGARGYPRVSIDTAKRAALVLQEMTPRVRVTLDVDPQSVGG
jgi:hypothetical protein